MDRVLTQSDRETLRALAAQVAEIAALPKIAARRRAWIQHNSLRSRQGQGSGGG